jgi:HAD superfamily hydrolase (TIGR01509 family)
MIQDYEAVMSCSTPFKPLSIAPRLVIFDMDGVLIDTQGLIHHIQIKELATYGLRFDIDLFIQRFCGETTKRVRERLKSEDGIDLPASFDTTVEQKVLQELDQGIPLIPGIKGLLSSLTLQKCVASNSKIKKLWFVLEKTGLLPFFEGGIFSADMVAFPKPSPDLFLHACHAFKVSPAEALVIEDSIVGVQAANKAHIKAFGFVGGSHLKGLLPHYQDTLLQTGAEKIFETIEQLTCFFRETI